MADRFTGPLGRFLRIEVASGVALLVASAIALGLSNSPWSGPFMRFWEVPVGFHFGSVDFTRSLRHWINDG
ncbi:MAG: Na+/H+ antiporter NhaA, partial [Planctomycetes bacterium]|nr:Na+/H+ antiporter NhaA [Planctomycetota bacterium]